jgi:class 3 adenylate cyclase
VLVSEAVRARVADAGSIALETPVEVELKGFTGTHPVYRVRR